MSSNIYPLDCDAMRMLCKESVLHTDSLHDIQKLVFEHCAIPEIDLRAFPNIKTLIIYYNKAVQTRVYFPPNLSKLVVYDSNIICMNPIPLHVHTAMICKSRSIDADISHLVNLKYLHYDSMNISVLPILPSSLLELYCQFNPALNELPALPPLLEKLDCRGCDLRSLPALPDGLQELCCDDNSNLASLPRLPPALKALCVRNCQLTSLPPLPDILHDIDVSNNYITEFHGCRIPPTLRHINICGNPVEYYPYVYRNRSIVVRYDYNQLWNVFRFTSFTLNGVNVYTPLHLLEPDDSDDDHYYWMNTSDIFDDDDAKRKLVRRLHVMCEIQNQVLCRAFMRTIKEELIMRTWHPSRILTWCGVDFGADD